jgi:hypothetical protein
MSTVIIANGRPRITNGVPPPRGATLASFVFFFSLAALLALLYAGSEWWRLAGGFGFTADAAWVRAAIARNLASGQGLCFNPGTPAAGAAGSSWIAALALLGLVTGNYLAAAKIAGVICLALAACFAWCVALDLLADWRFAFLAGLIVVASPMMISQGLGGAEAAWAALWLIAAIHWQAASWDGSNRLRAFSAVAIGLAALSRPELILLLPLSLLDRWIFTVKADAPGKRVAGAIRALPEIAGAAAVLAPFVVYNLRVGGPWWQQPALALRPPPLYTWALEAARSLWWDNPLVACAALVGLPVALLFALRQRSRCPTLLPVLAPIAFLLAPALIWPQSSADNATFTAAYLLPAMAVLAAAGLFLVHRSLQQWALAVAVRARRLALAGSIVIACTGLFGFCYWQHSAEWQRHGLQVEKVTNLQGYLGRWAADHLPWDASIASREVGAIGFFSRRRMVDLGGAISPDALAYLRRPGSPDTNLLEYLEKARPSHLAIRPADFPDLAQRADLLSPAVTATVTDRTSGGVTTMALYQTPWPPLSVMEARRQVRRH